MFGKADHMAAHVTEWVETAELLWHLEENTDLFDCQLTLILKTSA